MMTFNAKHSQNQSVQLFLLHIQRLHTGHLLKELLEPWMRQNYSKVVTTTVEECSLFELDKNYSIKTTSGFTLPSYVFINIVSIKTNKNGKFVTYERANKLQTRKVKNSIFGNEIVKINDNKYISAGSKRKQLLFTCEYLKKYKL